MLSGLNQANLWKIAAIAARITSDQRGIGNKGMRTNEKIRQDAGADAADSAISLKRFCRKEQRLARDGGQYRPETR